MKRWVLIWLSILAPALLTGVSRAQEPGQVVLESVILKEIEVVDDNDRKRIELVEVGNAVPGDELVFTISYSNQGSDPAENVVLVNPVPEQTVYISGTAAGEGASVTFSVDGGQTYGLPAELTVEGDDGQIRQARPDEYTHIRWVLDDPLPPGGAGSASFRARLK